MRQNKRESVEMDVGDVHDKPAETKNEDEQKKEAQGEGRT